MHLDQPLEHWLDHGGEGLIEDKVRPNYIDDGKEDFHEALICVEEVAIIIADVCDWLRCLDRLLEDWTECHLQHRQALKLEGVYSEHEDAEDV